MFVSVATVVVAVTGLASFVTASPLPEPQPQPSQNPCSPSFQGVATYIQAYDTYNRLTVPAGSQQTTQIYTQSAGQTKWRVEGSGSPANDYIIK